MGAVNLFEKVLKQVGFHRPCAGASILDYVTSCIGTWSVVILPVIHLLPCRGSASVTACHHAQDPDLRQRQVALYSATCVHASFGDAELAQVTLRGAPPASLASDRPARCLHPAASLAVISAQLMSCSSNTARPLFCNLHGAAA
jgi:hypothetical protein